LRDAENVELPGAFGLGNPNQYLTFQLTHGTPSNWTGSPLAPPNPAHWVQYCLAQLATPVGNTRALLYRVELSTATLPLADQCVSAVPVVGGAGGTIVSVTLMSGHIMSLHANGAVTAMGFQVYNDLGNPGIDFSHKIRLSLTADPTQRNTWDGAQYTNNPSITLVSQVSPRNYTPYYAGNNPPATATGAGSDRSFSGNYYDEIK